MHMMTTRLQGGGTCFWHEDVERGEAQIDRMAVHVNAPQGVAVLFNGDMQHAGQMVRCGVRHLYVASFNLRDAG